MAPRQRAKNDTKKFGGGMTGFPPATSRWPIERSHACTLSKLTELHPPQKNRLMPRTESVTTVSSKPRASNAHVLGEYPLELS